MSEGVREGVRRMGEQRNPHRCGPAGGLRLPFTHPNRPEDLSGTPFQICFRTPDISRRSRILPAPAPTTPTRRSRHLVVSGPNGGRIGSHALHSGTSERLSPSAVIGHRLKSRGSPHPASPWEGDICVRPRSMHFIDPRAGRCTGRGSGRRPDGGHSLPASGPAACRGDAVLPDRRRHDSTIGPIKGAP